MQRAKQKQSRAEWNFYEARRRQKRRRDDYLFECESIVRGGERDIKFSRPTLIKTDEIDAANSQHIR